MQLTREHDPSTYSDVFTLKIYFYFLVTKFDLMQFTREVARPLIKNCSRFTSPDLASSLNFNYKKVEILNAVN
jgi:hypothetical protein